MLDERDRFGTRSVRVGRAVIAVVSKWAFDYFALVAAVAATGAHVEAVPLLLAYVSASVLRMIPITPGGLGSSRPGSPSPSYGPGSPPRTPRWRRSRTGSSRTGSRSSRGWPPRSSTGIATRRGLVPWRPNPLAS